MKTAVILFTHPKDYPRAAAASAAWRKHAMSIFYCIESRHQDAPTPPWATSLVLDFDRCEHLQGSEAIHGERRAFEQLSSDFDCIVKLDSDTVVIRPEVFTMHVALGCDFAFVRRHKSEGANLANGCCYAMSQSAVRILSQASSAEIDQHIWQTNRNEDMFISSFFATQNDVYRAEIDKRRVWMCSKPYRQPDCIAAHFGYVSLPRMKEELSTIAPQLFDEIYNEDMKRYTSELSSYFNSKNEPFPIYPNIYNPDGNKIEPSAALQNPQLAVKGARAV